jgi:transposase
MEISIMSRLKIHHFAEVGVSQAKIARQIGCCERSVRKVLSDPPPTPAEIAAGKLDRRGPGAPSRTAPYAERVTALLTDQPRLPTMEVLRRARGEWGYRGGDTAFFDLVKRLRPAATPVEPMVRFDGLPGEFAQFDFGEVEVTCADGAVEKFHFFAGCLKFSRMKHVVITPDQKAERLVRATVDCLNAFGGAPKQWVYDNPKTVWVAKPGGGHELHSYLRQLVADLHVLVEPCTPRMAWQKGAVENLVGFVKKNFFLAYPFANRADVIAQLPQWLHRINHERPSDATGEIPAKRLEQELPRLNARPIPWTAADLPLRESATVSPTGAVRFRNTGYSVDPRYLGAPATLLVLERRIIIEVGKSRCEHVREDDTGEIRRLPEHSLAMAAIITAERKQTYFKRQCLLDMGPQAQQFLDRLIMRAFGNTWYADIHRLFDLYQRHGQDSLLAAMTEANSAHTHTYAAVLKRLKGVG